MAHRSEFIRYYSWFRNPKF